MQLNGRPIWSNPSNDNAGQTRWWGRIPLNQPIQSPWYFPLNQVPCITPSLVLSNHKRTKWLWDFLKDLELAWSGPLTVLKNGATSHVARLKDKSTNNAFLWFFGCHSLVIICKPFYRKTLLFIFTTISSFATSTHHGFESCFISNVHCILAKNIYSSVSEPEHCDYQKWLACVPWEVFSALIHGSTSSVDVSFLNADFAHVAIQLSLKILFHTFKWKTARGQCVIKQLILSETY